MATFNPFTPTFGIVPPYMAGRTAILNDMRVAFERGLGDPNLSTLIVGARGSGKTALLSCIADEAAAAGWIAVHAVPSAHMLEDIVQRAAEAASALVDTEPKRRLTNLGLGQLFEVGWADSAPIAPNWRSRKQRRLQTDFPT